MAVHLRGIGILLGCVVAVALLANAFLHHLAQIG